MDLARQTADEIERERLMQAAEHYGRIVNAEQGKIDSTRDPKDKTPVIDETIDNTDMTDSAEPVDSADTTDEEETTFPDFITDLK